MYVFCIFFIHSAVDGLLGCFLILAIVNSAARNVAVPVSSQIRAVVFSSYMFSGSYNNSIFSIFLKQLPCCST